MDLPKRVEEMLLEHRAKFQKQLERMDALTEGLLYEVMEAF
jgi:hypothetical protein